jgi:Fe-S oxidoreductase
MDVVICIRNIVVDEGRIAPRIRDVFESVRIHGNPWRRIKRERSEWAQGLKVKHISEGAEFLYFVGCTPSYDPRVQKVARAMVNCFNSAGVNFWTLGNEENCCGNEIYGMGEKVLFDFIVNENMKTFEKYGVKHVVTTSPHCYDAFKNKYGKTGFEVQHYTQFIASLIEKEKIRFKMELNKTVTYHDPCFLGKMNDVYDEPRKIIESIPGVKFIELDRSREKGICCEGGGGRMWMDVSAPQPIRMERSSETRIKEAVDAGAEILATACPFCILTLEDAVKTTKNEGLIQVMDIAELVSEAI